MEGQKQIMTALETVMERLLLSGRETVAQFKAQDEEIDRECEKLGLIRYSSRKPIRQFICPFYGHSDVRTSFTELHDLLQKVHYISTELHAIILRSEPPKKTKYGSIINDNLKISIDRNIAYFVAENFIFTFNDSDEVLLSTAYLIYLDYAGDNPVSSTIFYSCIADHFPDLTVTTRKDKWTGEVRVIRRVRFWNDYRGIGAKKKK
jgi:hypothetical protein